ncbi:MAG: ribosome silencing factor [Elusimicrobiota bacterium]
MITPKSGFKKIAVAAAFAGDSKKAWPVTIYDLAGKSPLADYAVLLAVESAPQLDAVEEEVRVRLKHEGSCCLHRDGMRSRNWKVLDYGGVLVHIYDGKAAGFYAIDKIYEGFKTVEWGKKPEPKPAVRKTAERRAIRKKTAKTAKPAKKASKVKKSSPVAKPMKKTVKKIPKKQ